MRTASNSLKLLFASLPELQHYFAPSFTTIKRWVQQVGYYKLIRKKTIANDWMLLVDASIQIGDKKCVLMLGIRESSFCKIKNRAVTLEDLEILSLRVVSILNSEIITTMLFEAELAVGNISVICSDRGSDILRGIRNFQEIRLETRHIIDTAHYVSNMMEAVLEKSPRWKEFRDMTTLARRKMQRSRVSGALPPSPRMKARYMNVGGLIRWASDMLVLLDHGVSRPGLDIDELRKYLGGLLSYRDDIDYWNRLILIGEKVRHVVRTEGIHINIANSFEEAVSSLGMGVRELQFFAQLTEFLQKQSKGTKPGECLIGSTEILESLFGKIKYMEREQKAYGFTSLLLAAMAIVGPLDEATVVKAMTSVKLSDIKAWTEKEIGLSVQSQRRKIKEIVAEIRASSAAIVRSKTAGILERRIA